jgi:hypothetical protein
MRVLIATEEGQGQRAGDYCWTVEGELVLAAPLLECHEPRRCGCGRGFPGLASARATTTALVADRAGVGPDDLRRAIRDSLDRQGWLRGLAPDDVAEVVADAARTISRTAGSFPLGAVLSRDGEEVWERTDVSA